MANETRQLLILMKGHPASGKSSIAQSLASLTKIPLIDKDDARDCLQRLSSIAEQTVDLNALSYEIMWQFAATQLKCRNSVIVDCPLARRELFEKGVTIAEEVSATVVVVECIVHDEGLWRRRLEDRACQDAGTARGHKPATWADLQALLHRYNGCDKWTVVGSATLEHHIIIDTGSEQNPSDSAWEVLRWLKARGLAGHLFPR